MIFTAVARREATTFKAPPLETRVGVLLALSCTAFGAPQDPVWIPTFPSSPLPEFDGAVRAFANFDDGSGEALFVGGKFGQCAGQAASLVARYDGKSWDNLAGGIPVAPFFADFYVADLAGFDNDLGHHLYAVGYNGYVENLARWSGFEWTLLPWKGAAFEQVVHAAIEVYDLGDGLGEQMFVAGYDLVANVPVLAVLDYEELTRIDEIPWEANPTGDSFYLTDVIGFDDGTGPALYLAGHFDLPETLGGGVARGIARYRDGQISALDASYWPQAYEFTDVRLAVHPIEGIPRLIAAWSLPLGAISNPFAALTAWDGTTWQDLGALNGTQIGAIASFDAEDGLGPCLVVSGNFTSIGGHPTGGLARLHGSNWLRMVATNQWLYSNRLASYRPTPGAPPSLLIASPEMSVGFEPEESLTRWQAGEVHAIHAPPAALNGGAKVLCSYDAGNGLELYAGGNFTLAGDAQVAGLARWDGSAWSPVHNQWR